MQLRTLDLLNPEHSRPTWDTYFIRLAEMAATRSSCILSKQGTIIVKESKVISTGYNGTPANMINCNQNGCEGCNRNDGSQCYCIHAEINALIEAGRSRTTGSDLYTTHFPCMDCARSILQSQIKRVIYSRTESYRPDVESFFHKFGIQVLVQFPAIAGQFSVPLEAEASFYQ
jgi:dCMP deaminase